MALRVKLHKLISGEDFRKFSYFRVVIGNQKITLVKKADKIYCYDQEMHQLEVIKINNDFYVSLKN